LKIQEDLEDITKGEILFPSPKTYYMEANTPKDEETGDYPQKRTLMCLKHEAHT